jgi:hypothetical protein
MSEKRGYISLIGVLVAGAVATGVSLTLIIMGLGYSKSSLTLQQSVMARAYANACAEEALEQVRRSTSFAGNVNKIMQGGSCSYTVISTGTQSKSIRASGTAGVVVRRLEIAVTAINPLITVSSWQEVP